MLRFNVIIHFTFNESNFFAFFHFDISGIFTCEYRSFCQFFFNEKFHVFILYSPSYRHLYACHICFPHLIVQQIEFKSNSAVTAATVAASIQTRHKPHAKLLQNEPNNSNNTINAEHQQHQQQQQRQQKLEQSFVHLRLKRSAFTIRLNYSTISVVKSDEKPARNDSNHSQRPVFASFRKFEKLSFDPTQYECIDKHSIVCLNKTNEFREKILSEFAKSLHDSSNETATTIPQNVYNVEYEHPDDMIKYNPTCMVLDAKLRILTKKDPPFDSNKIGRLFPTRKLFGKKYLSVPRSCVIVSSAGSLYQSGLGKFIGNY